jgi:hypothetical protein
MVTINPSLVPTISPGALFSRFTEDANINIRWFVANDPVVYSVLNRPIADLALRQLILAKTLDQLNLRIGHMALYPYLIQPKLISGTTTYDVPLSMIWDMHVSHPAKWEKLRLARVKRISGSDSGTETEHTGKVRFVFSGQQENSTTEVALFQADMVIDSPLQYQVVRIEVPTSSQEATAVDSGEAGTINGFIIFRTVDQDDPIVDAFLSAVAPPIAGPTDTNGDYTSPTSYEIQDSQSGGTDVVDDFDFEVLAHGTGLLLVTATNHIPDLNSDVQTLLNALNYPYDVDATRASTSPSGFTIPKGLFREFNLIAPSNDEPTGDTSGSNYPVWVSRVVREDVNANQLTFYFSTYGVMEVASTVPIEFAKLTLNRTDEVGTVVKIEAIANLFDITDATSSNWYQGFGNGHVVLSSLWSGTSSTKDDFFDSFLAVIDDPAEVVFTKASTRLSSFGLSRVPKTIPTVGQSNALKGSRAGVSEPSDVNRYIVEEDQGIGDQIDFATHTSLPSSKRENSDIERYGYTGSLAHRIVVLVVNSSGTSHDYDSDILPRLRILLGRDPIAFDQWWDGTRIKTFTPQGVWVG